jgi:DNA mismatch endonuclease, patch repair protein
MRQVKSKDTSIEIKVRSALQKMGLRFRKHCKNIPGKPDIVFPKEKIAVFVNGSFWHGYRYNTWRHNLNSYWQIRIETNIKRDRRNIRKLQRLGWKVIRAWDREVESNADSTAKKIAAIYRKRKSDINRRGLGLRLVEIAG